MPPRLGRQPKPNPGTLMNWPLVTPLQHFFRTSPQACPYLPGRIERKVITELPGVLERALASSVHPGAASPSPGAVKLYSDLSRAGFRRSHRYAYRPACPSCSACVPVRIPVARFRSQRSSRRLEQINGDLTPGIAPACAEPTHFQTFSDYVRSRHGDSDMATMSYADYRTMIEDSPVETLLVTLVDGAGGLAGACLTDVLDDGLSAVYSFYRPEEPRRSLGTFLVLKLIDLARARSLPYVYLGYWIGESRKMAYKTRFQPLEALGADGWQPLPLR